MTTEAEDASMTIGDLSSGDTGLLEMTCSGLLSSQDHDYSICSCHGDQVEFGRTGDTAGALVEDQKESEEQQHHQSTFNDISSPVPEPLKELGASPHVVDSLLQSPEVVAAATDDQLRPLRSNISLFNESTVNMDRLLSRLNGFSENESGFSNRSYSYADSTKFYSLGVGNLHDLLNIEDDDDELESDDDCKHDKPSDPVSINSVDLVEIQEDNSVSFRTSKILEDNPFIKSNGDLDVERIHEQAVIIEKNVLNNESSIAALVVALEISINDRANKDAEIEALKVQVMDLENQLQDGVRGGTQSVSPAPETETSHSELPNSEIEDLKLQVANLEKKLEVEKKYLETQTAERELERDDFQKTITELSTKIDDLRRDVERRDLIISNQKTELEDYEGRLRDVMEIYGEVQARGEKNEDELKATVEKIGELRSIIRDLEFQIDSATANATKLKEENLLLKEELDHMERLNEDAEQVEIDDRGVPSTANTDLTDELHAQVEDLARRLERKLNDMDNFQWSTRPNSSCSNAISVSNEDISVSRDIAFVNKEEDCVDVVTLIADGLRKLDSQFENLVRFEEIVMKKLKDAELRLVNTKKTQEELENEKQALQDKLKNQILMISDLENRLDQFRFEPSPNTLTLSGLRTRVAALNNEVEDYKGQLQLKELEFQDAMERLSAREALLSKLQKMPQPEHAPPILKSQASTQTKTSSQSASIQTEDNFKRPMSTVTVGVQTLGLLSAENLEISSIQGMLPVTHSTPNEATLVKTVARNLRRKNELESGQRFGSQFTEPDRSPEVLREPCISRAVHSVLAEQIPRIPDLKDLEPERPKKYESDYGDEPGGPRFDRLRDRAVEKDPRTGRDIPADASASSTLSTIRGAGGGNEVVAGVAQGRGIRKGRRSDDDDDVGAEDISNDEAANASGTGPFGSEGDNAEAGANARSTGSSSTAIRKDEKKSNSSQTPPLALANLVDALDEEEKKRLFEELARAEGIGSGKSSDEKDEEIGKLLNRIKELENACTDYKIKSGGGEGAGGSGGSCIIETSLDFDEKMKPVNAETRMNYVVTPGSTSAKSCQNVDPKILEEIKEILSRLGCDSNALLSLNEEQCMWVHKALTSMVQENSPPPVEPSAIAEDKCYTYEMETTVDFHVGQNGDLSVLGAEGKILPSESIAKVSPGAKPLENRSRSGSGSGSGNGRMNLVDRSVGGDSPVMEPDLNSSNVPWDQLQRTQEGRLHESDARVEVEVLKTQLDMVQQALEFEKEKNFCMDQTSTASELNQLLTQERARVQELRSVLDQQNMEVACLTERLQELELTVIGKGDLAASAPPNYQIPVDLQVAYAQMSYPHDVSPFHNQTYVVKHNPAIVEPVGPPSVMQPYGIQAMEMRDLTEARQGENCGFGNEFYETPQRFSCCQEVAHEPPAPALPSWVRGTENMQMLTRPDYAAITRRINFDDYAEDDYPSGGVGDAPNGLMSLDCGGRANNPGGGDRISELQIQAASMLVPAPPPPSRLSFTTEAEEMRNISPVFDLPGGCTVAEAYPANYSADANNEAEFFNAVESGTFVVASNDYGSGGVGNEAGATYSLERAAATVDNNCGARTTLSGFMQ